MAPPKFTECSKCYFFRPIYESAKGICHRYPPTGTFKFGLSHFNFTQVYPSDWCGEYKPKNSITACTT